MIKQINLTWDNFCQTSASGIILLETLQKIIKEIECLVLGKFFKKIVEVYARAKLIFTNFVLKPGIVRIENSRTQHPSVKKLFLFFRLNDMT